jgi:hypothetical protein
VGPWPPPTKSALDVDFSTGHSLQPRKSWWWWIHFAEGGNGRVALMGLHTLPYEIFVGNRCTHYQVLSTWMASCLHVGSTYNHNPWCPPATRFSFIITRMLDLDLINWKTYRPKNKNKTYRPDKNIVTIWQWFIFHAVGCHQCYRDRLWNTWFCRMLHSIWPWLLLLWIQGTGNTKINIICKCSHLHPM